MYIRPVYSRNIVRLTSSSLAKIELVPGSSELLNCHKPFAIRLSEQGVEHE